ncbi:MAG: 2-oxoglutarate dehydrogenase E1 component, partial [Gammaproteobacteria bacterium]
MSDSTTSCLYSGNASFIEDLYEDFLRDPTSISAEWREYFTAIQEQAGEQGIERPHSPVQKAFLDLGKSGHRGGATQAGVDAIIDHQKQASVLQLINAHRFRGHQQATLDPLNQHERPPVPELDPAFHNLTEADMDQSFNTGSLVAPAELPLREILKIVRTTYCGNIGAEYMHINETEQKRWIQQRLEGSLSTPDFSTDKKKRILNRVIAATVLEEYLHTKYAGQKRFS